MVCDCRGDVLAKFRRRENGDHGMCNSDEDGRSHTALPYQKLDQVKRFSCLCPVKIVY